MIQAVQLSRCRGLRKSEKQQSGMQKKHQQRAFQVAGIKASLGPANTIK